MTNHVFISYSRKDVEQAIRIEEGLRAAGLSVWRDQRIAAGQVFSEEIAATIESVPVVVWLGSMSSIESDWVCRELEFATSCRKTIIPVYLDERAIAATPGRLKLLFPHAHYVLLDDASWDQRFGEVVEAVKHFVASQGSVGKERPAKASPPAATAKTAVSNGEEPEWPGDLPVVGPPPEIDLLPIDEASPMIVGAAIDVSGSMQETIQSESEQGRSRLQGVLDGVKTLAQRFRQRQYDGTVEEALPLFRLFAYGFGFADRAAKYGKLGKVAKRFVKDLPPVPARVYRGPVRDLFEIAGLQAKVLSPNEVEMRWEQIQSGVWDQRIDLFGPTPMRKGLETVEARFAAEFAEYAGVPHSALLLVSDGISKDGCPVEICRRIASRGTVIFCCYLTSGDVSESKRLYARPQPDWPEGALTLFGCSTVLSEDTMLLEPLLDKGWQAKEGDRLFVQLNHSALLSEFMGLISDLGSAGVAE